MPACIAAFKHYHISAVLLAELKTPSTVTSVRLSVHPSILEVVHTFILWIEDVEVCIDLKDDPIEMRYFSLSVTY